MKAIVHKIDDVGVEVIDLPYPTLRPGWVIIKVKAAGICGSDLHGYVRKPAPQPPGAPAVPRRAIGHEVAGEVVEVGAGVTDVVVGDRVTYHIAALKTLQNCGKCYPCLTGHPLGCLQGRSAVSGGGGMAEYQLLNSEALFKLPDNVPYEIGALVEPFAVGYHPVIEESSLQPSQTIVILGPGTIGLCALIAAKLVTPGKTIMTGTNGDVPVRFKLAKELGANVLINVQQEDAVKRVLELTNNAGADVVVECIGGKYTQAIPGFKMLAYGGEYIGIGHPDADLKDAVVMEGSVYTRMQFQRQRIIMSWIYDIVTYWRILKLLELGLVDLKPLITHRVPLTEAVKGFEMGLKQECVKAMLFP